MANLPFDKFLNMFKKNVNLEESNEYVELEVDQKEKPTTKLYVKYYNLVKFEDSGVVLNDIRSGYTLSFIKIKEIKDKGGIEAVKRVRLRTLWLRPSRVQIPPSAVLLLFY